MFILIGGAISWLSKLQTVVALSITEAEYMARDVKNPHLVGILAGTGAGINVPPQQIRGWGWESLSPPGRYPVYIKGLNYP